MKKLLSLGSQTFSAIRENGKGIYIDKTKQIYHLATSGVGQRIFLSRPRRFGKSLLCSTFKSLFKGERQYFKGLYIEDKRDWEQQFPVLHISFGSGVTKDPNSLKIKLGDILYFNTIENNIDELKAGSIDGKFKELIMKLYNKTGMKVVVIIDEYDKPIIDMIKNPELANNNKDELKNFYAVLKDADEYLQFVFITGVSKFSKVSLFSGLNNLKDISFMSDYATLCGYTIDEIIDNYGPEGYLDGVNLEEMKKRYNGYNFNCTDKSCMVYNPYGILSFFDNHNEYGNYRFQSATPTFLIDMLKKKGFPTIDFENIQIGQKIFESFDIENIDLIILMFQTGYLTIKKIKTLGKKKEYTLAIPNQEVRESLNNYLVEDYFGITDKISHKVIETYKSMQTGDPERFINVLKSLFAGIPYTNYTKNNIAQYEGFYSSVLYSFLASTGIDMVFEDITNLGRIDLTMKFEKTIFIIEFKVDKSVSDNNNDAITQIKSRNYQQKYVSENSQIFLVGIQFDEEKRNIGRWEVENV